MTDVRRDYVTPNDFFWKFLSAHRKQTPEELQTLFAKRRFSGIDPGETTGMSNWADGKIELFQLETKQIGQAYDLLDVELSYAKPDAVRCEEYRVYNWMADQHSWSILHTPQLIGAIKVLCHREGYPLTFKLAQHAKAMWTDDNLKRCGLYSAGMKHARDACRHLLYYMAKPLEQD